MEHWASDLNDYLVHLDQIQICVNENRDVFNFEVTDEELTEIYDEDNQGSKDH